MRIDGGAVGLGHAVRSSGVVNLLGDAVDLVLVGQGAGLERWFPAVPRIDPVRPLAEICREQAADAVLLDIPHYPPGLFAELRRTGLPLICIDDMGGAIDADLVINGTVLQDYHSYPQVPAGSTLLLGPRYALIRLDFGRIRWAPPLRPNVLIVVGSGERAREWAYWLVTEGVDGTAWGSVTMVVGAAFPDFDVIAELGAQCGISLRCGLDAGALAHLLANASVALITGGMIVYEALAVGVPAVVFPLLANMLPEARWLAERGCILGLGGEGGMEAPTVRSAVGHLLSDHRAAEDMSRRQRSLVDGGGMERAARAIARLLGGVTR